MRNVAGVLLAILWMSAGLFAAGGDTTVFRTRMLPDNEVPSLSLPGNSAVGQVTVRVVRNSKGAISAATVVFDVDFSFSQNTTVIGMHIHNAPAGVSGPVVINSGLSSNVPVVGTSGHVTRVVNFTSSDTTALGFVTGILSTPERYYLNMHSTVIPAGFVRGQLQANTVTFRPLLSPGNEVPPVAGLDAQAAGLITVRVNRDDSGAIVSGSVTFDMDYRFSGSVTITGMHIHSAAAGVSGPVVISSGIGKNPITNSTGRGTIFRIAEIPTTDATGLKALAGLMTDPSGYYVNMHTQTHQSGAIRGQLDRDTVNFFSHLEGSQEIPPSSAPASADVVTTLHVSRDITGNITNGDVTFSVNFQFDGATTMTGMHIHNAPIGITGNVVISSGLDGAANAVKSDTGSGTFSRQVTIDSGNTAGLGALYGVIETPDLYYINIHTTVIPSGAVRAQLGRETYHFRPVMSPANETTPITSSASGTSWLTVFVNRDAAGAIASGTVIFDVDYDLAGAATITGMHIHRGQAAENGPVLISSGVSSIASTSGTGNITTTAAVAASNTAGINALAGLIDNPGGYYINLHTDAHPPGFMRSQLLPFVNFSPQVAGGGDWMTFMTITNPSATAAVRGLVKILDQKGNPMSADIIDPTLPFEIPPSGSVTFTTFNTGNLSGGFARIHSSAPVTSTTGFAFDGLGGVPAVSPAVGTTVSIPVAFGSGGIQNAGIALLDLDSVPPTAVISLRDSAGAPVPGGSSALSFPASKQIVGLLSQFLPSVATSGAQFTGTLVIQLNIGPFAGGHMSVLALQFDTGKVVPITVQVIQ